MSIADICNYVQVSERLASSGQPENHQFKPIAEAGYQGVINLAMPDSQWAIPDEGKRVASLNMSYVHIPVPFDKPNASHLKEFIKIMEAYSEQKVWVHCALNYRVSAFLYQYQRLVQNESPREAKKVMLTSWEPDDTWKAFMALSGEEIGLSGANNG